LLANRLSGDISEFGDIYYIYGDIRPVCGDIYDLLGQEYTLALFNEINHI